MSAPYTPAPVHLELGRGFSDEVSAASFPEHTLRFRNDRAAATVGLDHLSDTAWVDHFGRFAPLPDNLPTPRALRYHGHQFRHYNPELGDGRGFLFAQVRDARGRVLDLGTKGSGRTPYSRGGDGRLTLQGAVREILATELLEARGVDTSKTLSVIETGESLVRHDEPSPTRGAALVRLSWSHVRIGSFQRLAAFQEDDLLVQLAEHTLEHHYPHRVGDPPAVALVEEAVERCAATTAGWMAAGFVHGVLNTDNINLTGESFDYGPWRFAPTFDPRFTAAYFDEGGLYAFGRQPEAMLWNLHRLCDALTRIAPAADLAAAVDPFFDRFRAWWRTALLARLGLAPTTPKQDTLRARTILEALRQVEVGHERFFFDAWGGSARAPARFADSPASSLYRSRPFDNVRAWLYDAAPAADARLDHPYWQGADPCDALNDETRALWAPIAERDDWRPLERKIAEIRAAGEAMGLAEQVAARPFGEPWGAARPTFWEEDGAPA